MAPSGPPPVSLLTGYRGHFVQFLALISSWVRCCKLFIRNHPMENNFMGSLSHTPRVNCSLASGESTFEQPQPPSTSIHCALSLKSQETAFWSRQSISFSVQSGLEIQFCHSIAVWPCSDNLTSLNFGSLIGIMKITPSLPGSCKNQKAYIQCSWHRTLLFDKRQTLPLGGIVFPMLCL